MQDCSRTLYGGYMLSVCYPRWVLPIMDYTGILRPRGASFQARGIENRDGGTFVQVRRSLVTGN